ncbi:hypothetical protein U752_07370 [Streptococcus pseudopneumoniae 1321]|nr:hypothetical protein U752_07370 [Streptococcus pseudopneumoniae 1321]
MKGKNSQGIGRLEFGEGRPLMLKAKFQFKKF